MVEVSPSPPGGAGGPEATLFQTLERLGLAQPPGRGGGSGRRGGAGQKQKMKVRWDERGEGGCKEPPRLPPAGLMEWPGPEHLNGDTEHLNGLHWAGDGGTAAKARGKTISMSTWQPHRWQRLQRPRP
jgi:hypothetical protein